MKPIKNAPGLYRDEKTNVVINTNESEYKMILERRRHKKELDKVTSEVNDLKRELDELKTLIKATAR